MRKFLINKFRNIFAKLTGINNFEFDLKKTNTDKIMASIRELHNNLIRIKKLVDNEPEVVRYVFASMCAVTEMIAELAPSKIARA